MNFIQKFLFSRPAKDKTTKSFADSELRISIITTTSYIICRSWEWEKTSEQEIEILKKELLILKNIAVRDQKKSLFCSKYLLPNDIKIWLKNNEIPFEEN